MKAVSGFGYQIHADAVSGRPPPTEIRQISKEKFAVKTYSPQNLLARSILGLSVAVFSTAAIAAVDADAAQALAKKSDCLKCHAVDKDKKASSYKSIAAKWKGKPDAEAKLIDSLTKSPKVKMKDGTEEEHKAIPTKDMGEIKNLVAWILAQ